MKRPARTPPKRVEEAAIKRTQSGAPTVRHLIARHMRTRNEEAAVDAGKGGNLGALAKDQEQAPGEQPHHRDWHADNREHHQAALHEESNLRAKTCA